MKVLVLGWTKIPHSYSIVNVFQLVHLKETYPDLKLYMREEPYFRNEWSKKTDTRLYPEFYYKILESIEPWVGQDVDLVYSITYPYNIDSLSIERNGTVSTPLPKCVFFTSEFGKLDVNYFALTTQHKFVDDDFLRSYINTPKNKLYFTSPSAWSSKGLDAYCNDQARNVIISHGVDTRIFKRESPQKRQATREFYKISPTDVLLCNVGAMTRNKGIVTLLQAFKTLVIDNAQTQYKLVLKGMEDLYSTRQFVSVYLKEIGAPAKLYSNIVFIDKTMSFKGLNNLYNAIDVYVSPYIAEGFNLVPLEAIAAGARVILPRGGSTAEYTSALEQFDCIEFVDCHLDVGSGCNVYNSNDLVSSIVKASLKARVVHEPVHDYISKNLSWTNAAVLLKKYFDYILNA